KGVRLTLWGNLPELSPVPSVLESLVILHHHDALDLDVSLRRGRILVSNDKPSDPARVRVLFDNPANTKAREIWNMVMQPRSEVLLDRWSSFPPNEPFYKDPNDSNRLGPTADLALVVLKGEITLTADDLTVAMKQPPGPAVMAWNSAKRGVNGPLHWDKVPGWLTSSPPVPKGMDIRVRPDMLPAREHLD